MKQIAWIYTDEFKPNELTHIYNHHFLQFLEHLFCLFVTLFSKKGRFYSLNNIIYHF